MKMPGFVHDHPVASGVAVVTACGIVVGIAVASEARDTRPMQTSQGAEMFNASEFTEAVDFYRALCPPVLELRNASDTFRLAVENSIGEPDENRDAMLRSAVDTIAEHAAIGADELPATGPQISLAQQVEPVDYTAAVDPVRTVLTEQSRALFTATGSEPGDKSLSAVLWEVVGTAGDSAGRVAADLSRTAPLPNQKTLDAVASSAECSGLYDAPPVPPGQVHRPQLELYTAVDRAHRLWQEVVDRYAAQPGMDRYTMVAELGDAATRAQELIQAWLDANTGDPVTTDLDGARDAIGVYRSIAEAAADGDGVGADLQGWVNDEAKLQVRLPRIAPLVNRETSDEITAATGD